MEYFMFPVMNRAELEALNLPVLQSNPEIASSMLKWSNLAHWAPKNSQMQRCANERRWGTVDYWQ